MLNWDPLGKGLYRDKNWKKSPHSALPGQRQQDTLSVQAASPKGLATLLSEPPSGAVSDGVLSTASGPSPKMQDGRGLQILAEAAAMRPRSILKRGLPSDSAEPASATKKVRFQEPSAVMMVEGRPVYLSRKAYADLRGAQQQLSWLFNVMEGTALILAGTPAEKALAPLISLYYGQIEPHQAQLNQRFRALMRSQPGEVEALPMKATIDDWQWQKALTDFMERCLKATRQEKAVQDNEFLEGDFQDILEIVGAQRQSLGSIFSSAPDDAL